MSIYSNKTIIITGANRGIGKALLQELLTHNPAKIYATARDTSNLLEDERIEPITLDLLDDNSVAELGKLSNIDFLINNAGVLFNDAPKHGEQNMAVNYYGTVNVTETVLPNINAGGGIVTTSSLVGLAPMYQMASYSASKAAIHSYIQAKRQELKDSDIFVAGVYPGAIDTDMLKDVTMTKANVNETAKNILAGFENKEEYIFPDPMSKPLGESYLKDTASLEKAFG